MTGKELLPLIRANCKGDRYSENLMKWVRKHREWPMVVAFIGHCSITGERLEYDPTKSMARQIVVGLGDMSDGWIHGRRLSEVICGLRGVLTHNYAYSHQFFPVELPDWWQGYIEGGKCFIDPEHWLYADHERWEVSEDRKTRRCLWCGNHEQFLHSEMVKKTSWRKREP
jgi:hypothetical protein